MGAAAETSSAEVTVVVEVAGGVVAVEGVVP
jgi:hypothetical protein